MEVHWSKSQNHALIKIKVLTILGSPKSRHFFLRVKKVFFPLTINNL